MRRRAPGVDIVKNVVRWFVAGVLIATATAAAAESAYPFLDADMVLHALYVNQENFRATTSVFGRGLDSASGNFNRKSDAEEYRQTMESRARLMLTPHFTDGIFGRVTLETNPVWGDEQGFADPHTQTDEGADNAVHLREFNIQAEHAVGGYLGYRIGRQLFTTPRELVVGDADADGLAFWYRAPEVGLFEIAAAVLDTRDTHEIEDVYGFFSYQFPAHQVVTGSLYLSTLYFRDRTSGPGNDAPEISQGGGSSIGAWLVGPSTTDLASMSRGQLYWAGAQLDFTGYGFAVAFDAIMNFGNLDPGQIILQTSTGDVDLTLRPTNRAAASRIDTVQGALLQLDVAYARSIWRCGAAGAFVSGHDANPEATRYTGYLDVNADFRFTRFFFEGGPYLVASGFASPAVQGSGVVAAKIYADVTPLDWLTLNLQTAALAADMDRPQLYDPMIRQEYDRVANGAGRYYGTEVDLWLEINPGDRLHWLAEADYFQPGNYFRGSGRNDEGGNGFAAQPDPAWRLAGGFLFF